MDSERIEEDDIFNETEFSEETSEETNDNFSEEIDDTSSENTTDEETLEKAAATRKRARLFYRLLAFVNAIILCGCVYVRCCTYFPLERTFLEDNLFSGNDVIASQEELDEIVGVLEDELNVSIPEEYEDEYYLLNAVKNNPNLSDSEKEFFYKYVKLFIDNPYLNREEAYRSLLNVEISYKARPIGYAETIQGVYVHDRESIGIFEKDTDKSTLAHEVVHCIYCNENTVGLPTYFKEGMTELLVNEYFSDSPFLELQNYPFEIAAVKMLCEVTSADTVLKAFSLGDMGIIAEEIAAVTGDYDEAVHALEQLDYTFQVFNDELEEGHEEKELYVLMSSFIPLFRDCVTLKYAENDPERISYFYNEVLFANILSENPYESYLDDLLEFGCDHKAYFSSELKKAQASEEVLDKICDASDEKAKTLEKQS